MLGEGRMTQPDHADSISATTNNLARAYRRISELENELTVLRQRLGLDSQTSRRPSRRRTENRPKVTSVGSWEYAVESDRLFWTSQVKAIHEVPLDYEPTLTSALQFFAQIMLLPPKPRP